jgi:dUTP pyrophosphatase
MPPINIKIKNESGHPLPAYATADAAGMDIMANLPTPLVLQPMQRSLIPTGLFIELPQNFEAQIRPRSGLAIKNGITCLNTPGTIDADYRGEIKVILINLSNEPHTIQNGDRIAQMIVAPVTQAVWQEVTSISATQRNDGGFGHTGK